LLGFVDVDKTHSILEIGCFEGLSSVFFADNLLHHPDSTLTCVDPFMTVDNNDHASFLQNDEEKSFDYNTSVCANAEKIVVYKETSDAFFLRNTKVYDLIYIDGCHEPDFITRDMENSFKVLQANGIMWMDDYGGGKGGTIKNTMDLFLTKHTGEYVIIHQGYQLAIQKK